MVVIYGIVVAANAAINGETDLVRGAQTVANQLLGRVSALTLIACLLTVAVLLSWFGYEKGRLKMQRAFALAADGQRDSASLARWDFSC